MIVGRYGTSHIVTLVERHSRVLIAIPLPHGAKSENVIAALIETFNKLPAVMRRTRTRGQPLNVMRGSGRQPSRPPASIRITTRLPTGPSSLDWLTATNCK